MSREVKNVPMSYEEQLAAEVANMAKRISAPTGNRLRFNSNMSIITPDGNEGEAVDVVIVDFVSTNLFYDRPYNKDKPVPPACFAIGSEPSMLIPSENSPNVQSTTCATCPMNQFGSSPNGRGKACKNTRVLAVAPILENGEAPPLWLMSVSPSAMKPFDAYVHSLASKHRTIPTGVVTEITLDTNVQYSSPKFRVVRPLEGAELGVYMELRGEAMGLLSTEPDVSTYEKR
jgi:hypothetical protein